MTRESLIVNINVRCSPPSHLCWLHAVEYEVSYKMSISFFQQICQHFYTRLCLGPSREERCVSDWWKVWRGVCQTGGRCPPDLKSWSPASRWDLRLASPRLATSDSPSQIITNNNAAEAPQQTAACESKRTISEFLSPLSCIWLLLVLWPPSLSRKTLLTFRLCLSNWVSWFSSLQI